MERTEQQKFLETYDINQYDRPSLAVDIAVFTIGQEEQAGQDIRRLPVKKLKLLLIKRAEEPFRGQWALPGGFVQQGETVYDAARRELKEETGTAQAYLRLCGVFSEKDRDPRGWIISQAFMAIQNSYDISGVLPKAGGDAMEASWFDITLKTVQETKKAEGDSLVYDTEYQLLLSCVPANDTGVLLSGEQTKLEAVVWEHKEYRAFHELTEYKVGSAQGIAFDHAKIITCMCKQLRRDVENDTRIAFDFLPELFTLTDLQEVFEQVLDRELVKPNFRRKIVEYVIETEQMVQNGAHRPAKAFRRNLDQFLRKEYYENYRKNQIIV